MAEQNPPFSNWGPGATPGGGWVPVPDPTTLTTAQLRRELDQATNEIRREIESVRLLLATRLDAEIASTNVRVSDLTESISQVPDEQDRSLNALQNLMEARLDALEKKLALRFEEVRGIPAQAKTEIAHLRELHESRFDGIELQFRERDVRGEQEKKASKEALDAALLAQKESVSQQNDANTTAATKTETNFTKQIDLVGTQINALDKSLSDRISELKERIDRGEGANSGAAGQRNQTRLNVNVLAALAGVVLTALILVVGAYAAFHK
jgi:hypothetical protein